MGLKATIKRIIGFLGKCMYIKTLLFKDKARSTLQSFSPKPIGTCCTKNTLNLKYDLQIIIPCYNVEKWVKQCLESVLNQQTKYNVLVSIVNDGSTDGTEDIIRSVMTQYKFPEVIGGGYTLELKTQKNRGFSGARNAALKGIKGTYVMFLDSDDVIIDGAIDKMLDVAFEENAEILQGGWYEFNEAGDREERRINKLSGFPWGKLYKSNVMEYFQFPEDFWFEDTPLSFI